MADAWHTLLVVLLGYPRVGCPFCSSLFVSEDAVSRHVWRSHLEIDQFMLVPRCWCGIYFGSSVTEFRHHLERHGGCFAHYLSRQLGVDDVDG